MFQNITKKTEINPTKKKLKSIQSKLMYDSILPNQIFIKRVLLINVPGNSLRIPNLAIVFSKITITIYNALNTQFFIKKNLPFKMFKECLGGTS